MSVWRQITPASKPTITNRSILSILQSCNSIHIPKQIHAYLITTSLIKDTFLVTKLLETIAISAHDLNYAHRIFNQITFPNSYTYTTMIRGCCDTKIPEKAIKFYEIMRVNGVEENRFTFLFMLKAYAMKLCCIEGKFIHGKVLKMGFDCDVFINSGLISLYSKCRDIGSARKLFDGMPVKNNVINWNTLLTAYYNCGDLENADKLFNEMPVRNVDSWNVAIAGYCKVGQVDVARSLFDKMEKRDLVSWASMITGYIHQGMAAKALELFEKMEVARMRPDSVIITSALSACAQLGALDKGKQIHAYVNEYKLAFDLHLGTALVDMYAKCGCIDIAMELFIGMPCKNICTWNAMLSGLSSHGHGLKVLELFKEMKSVGVRPNDVTFVAVLSACSHVGAIDEGRKLFKRMERDYKVVPKVEHYGCMVDILGRGGFVDETKELIKSMPMEPNIELLGAFLNACSIHGYTDIDDDMVARLHHLTSENTGAYVLLSNISAANSDWASVQSLRKKILQNNTEKKIPGCSSLK